MESCRSCRFGVVDPEHVVGSGGEIMQCRRHPPTIVDGLVDRALKAMMAERDGVSETWSVLHDVALTVTKWPGVDHDGWCGEWEPKPAATPAQPAPLEWPTWDDLLARPELNVAHTGARSRQAIFLWRRKNPGGSVESAMAGFGLGLRGEHHFGDKCHRLVLSAIEGWRRDKAEVAK